MEGRNHPSVLREGTPLYSAPKNVLENLIVPGNLNQNRKIDSQKVTLSLNCNALNTYDCIKEFH